MAAPTSASSSYFVAGHYTATWKFNSLLGKTGAGPKSIGTTIDGFNYRWIFGIDEIRIDDYPGIVADGIFTGKAIELTFQLAQAGETFVDNIVNPFSVSWGAASGGVGNNDQTIVGTTLKDSSGELVLTPSTYGGNAANQPITFSYAIAHVGSQQRLGNHNLVYPMTMLVLPDPANSGRLYTPAYALNRSTATD